MVEHVAKSIASGEAFRNGPSLETTEAEWRGKFERWWIRPASFLGFFPDNLRKYKGSLGGTGGSTLLSPSCQQINVLGLQKRAVGRDFRRGPTNTFLKFTLNLETPRTYVSSRAENTRMGRMDDKHRGKISVDGKRLGILGVDYYERSMDITSEPTYLSEDRQFSHDGGIP